MMSRFANRFSSAACLVSLLALALSAENFAKAEAPDLAAELAAAKAAFAPQAAGAVAKAAKELNVSLIALNTTLARMPDGGAGWRKYLLWDELAAELPKADAPLKAFDGIVERFNSDRRGLELPVFTRVSEALEDYLRQRKIAAEKDLKSQFEQQIDTLSKAISDYEQTPNHEHARAVAAGIGFLKSTDQSAQLIDRIQRKFSHYNLFAQVSEAFVSVGLGNDLNDVSPVSDVILGTTIRGTARTVGKVSADIVPNKKYAQIDTVLSGVTYSNTTGYNGPAVVHTVGTTTITGRKRLLINALGISSYPATAEAHTSTKITGVGTTKSGVGSRLIQRVASDRVAESKGQAERIGSQHAEARVRNRVEEEARKSLGKAQWEFMENFRNPLLRQHVFPRKFDLSSDSSTVFAAVELSDMFRLGAPDSPPAHQSRHDIAVQLHESWANNFAEAVLGGQTIREEDLQKKVIEMQGSLPDKLKSDPERDPWSITFANRDPVTVALGDGGFSVTIRGKRYTSGEREFKAMNVTARYKVNFSGNAVVFTRQGEVEVFPPGFDPDKTKLSTAQVTLRTLLQKKFAKLFEPEMRGEGLELKGRFAKIGKLPLREAQFERGWAVLGWQLPRRAARVASRQ